MYDFTLRAMKKYWDISLLEVKQRMFVEEAKLPSISKIDKLISVLEMKGLSSVHRLRRKQYIDHY